MDRVTKLASERAVVVFTVSSCCMCHAVTSLLGDLGVSAAVYELDKDPRGREKERELVRKLGRGPPVVPAVFIGGNLVDGTNRIMSLHLAGELVPMLKSAGALWSHCRKGEEASWVAEAPPPLSLGQWRELFGSEVFEALDAAVAITALDDPTELRRRRDHIMELLFAPPTASPAAIATKGGAAPVRKEEIVGIAKICTVLGKKHEARTCRPPRLL